MELIITAIFVILLNVADSVSTELCLRQYPSKDLKAEGNPIMRWLMLRNRYVAEAVKHIGVLVLVAWFIYVSNLPSVRLLGVMLGLVVINNMYVYLSRKIAKRKVISPMMLLTKFAHVPEKYAYIPIVIIIVGMAQAITHVVWG